MKTLKENKISKKNRYPRKVYNMYDTAKLLKRFLLNRSPLNYKTENVSCTPFFIIGSGRSGNTLLRAMLTSHSEISIPPESYVLNRVIRKFHTYNFLEWDELVKIVIGEFESHQQFPTWDINTNELYQRLKLLSKEKRTLANIIDELYVYYSEVHFPGSQIWGDKTPLNTLGLNWLDSLFPNAKYIHIIRDGRDVANSYQKAGLYDLKYSCERWNESITRAKKFGRKKERQQYYEVQYEDIVRNPKDELKKICNFLNIKFEESMLSFYENIGGLGDTSLSHHKNLNNSVNKNSIGKWEHELSLNEKEYVNSNLEKNLKMLGYK
ncbi:hypothetical protein J2R98_002608 [Alkalibacillus filiformis]|uniref:Sulfotransferase family protein n=1 Tax=Alkalibacillus filiformis TaxID=200990 RepID=A0ABU0DWB4_9BACI|nr:sulfotransferase [Alkalibacillus filiformis]MDQ0352757.1 hypothetical protein [Alkalibacillus filiformis]